MRWGKKAREKFPFFITHNQMGTTRNVFSSRKNMGGVDEEICRVHETNRKNLYVAG